MLDVAPSGYFYWRTRPPSIRQLRQGQLADLVLDIYRASNGTYGKRRITAELRLGYGMTVNQKAVRAAMRRLGIQGLPAPKRKRRGPQSDGAAAGDLVARQFAREAPDQLWLTDITEHPTREGKLYCCAVLDAHSRRVVGWSIDSRQATSLVTSALGMAVKNRKPTSGTVVHCDHGSQFTSWAFSERIKTAGLALSMGRIGDAYDNGMMEAFWARMQTEFAQPQTMAHPAGARQRDLRVPRDLPQPQAPPLQPRNAHTSRI
jgi:transposase InsO family protein